MNDELNDELVPAVKLELRFGDAPKGLFDVAGLLPNRLEVFWEPKIFEVALLLLLLLDPNILFVCC